MQTPEEILHDHKTEMAASVYEAESGLLITSTGKENNEVEHTLTMFGKGDDFIKCISHALKNNKELRDIFTEAFEQSGKAPYLFWYKATVAALATCTLAMVYHSFTH